MTLNRSKHAEKVALCANRGRKQEREERACGEIVVVVTATGIGHGLGRKIRLIKLAILQISLLI